MVYTIKVNEDDLSSFLRSITSHSKRETVKNYLEGAGLVWSNYWELPVGKCRRNFIRACFWANLFPTTRQLEHLFRQEKLSGPANMVLSLCNGSWWAVCAKDKWYPIITQALSNLSSKELLSLARRCEILTIVKCAPKSFLPLLIGHYRLWSVAKEELERRLKE